jgi:hypothetical protein
MKEIQDLSVLFLPSAHENTIIQSTQVNLNS